MTEKNRLQEKNEMFAKLGALFGPLQHLAQNPEMYDEQERAEVIARYCADWTPLYNEFIKFSMGQAGHNYHIQKENFGQALSGVVNQLKTGLPIKAVVEGFGNISKGAYADAMDAISAIPIPKNSEILEAHSPFTAFCKIKDLVESDASHELIWVDAYMDLNIFHRFLRGVAPGVAITLVTAEPKATASKKEKARWDAFLDVSRLFALERGPALYCLVVHPDPHDRWLLLDGKRAFHLGGSAKDAANRSYFTISRLDASAANLKVIQDHITGGVEYFGTTVTTHL